MIEAVENLYPVIIRLAIYINKKASLRGLNINVCKLFKGCFQTTYKFYDIHLTKS